MPTSTYLGQFTDANAERLADAFEDAGIAWSTKTPGRFTRILFAGDWGVRMFVEDERLDEAREIARGIAPDGLA